MTLAALGNSAMSALVKVASVRLPTGEIVLARTIITLVLSYLMVRRAGLYPWGKHQGRLMLRGALGFIALASFYLAEAYRSLGRPAPAEREYRNTLQQLDGRPPGELLDGVAVGWLRETCRRQLEYLRLAR